MRLEHSVEIARPPEEVYAYLADPSNLAEWQGAVDEVEWSGGEAGVGDRFREARHFMGRSARSSVEVTVAEPGREFAVAASAGPVDVSARHLLEPVGGGATVVRVEVEVRRVPRLLAPVASRAARRQAEQDLTRLKELLEA